MKFAPVVARAEDEKVLLSNAEVLKREINSIAGHIINIEGNIDRNWEISVGNVSITLKFEGSKNAQGLIFDTIWVMTLVNNDLMELKLEVAHEELVMLLAHLDKDVLELMMNEWQVAEDKPCNCEYELEVNTIMEYPVIVGSDTEYFTAMNRFGYYDRILQALLENHDSEYFRRLERRFENAYSEV